MSRATRRRPLSGRVLRRVALLGAAAVVALPVSLVGTSPATAAPTVAPTGAEAQERSTRWLAGKLREGLLPGFYYSVTAEAGLSLQRSGGQGRAVRSVRAALEREVDGWLYPVEGYLDATNAALALVVAQELPGGPSDGLAGRGVLALLEGAVDDAGTARGRVRDDLDNGAEVRSQSTAARALRVAGSPEARAATRYLLDQQCAGGGFRQYLPRTEARRGCDDALPTDDATPDLETTLHAVLDLQAGPGGRTAARAVDTALDWVAARQVARGRVGEDSRYVATAVLTGLAAQALAADGRCARARGAARWLQGVQLPSGAVARNTAERDAILEDGFDRDSRFWTGLATIAAGPALSLTDRGACRS